MWLYDWPKPILHISSTRLHRDMYSVSSSYLPTTFVSDSPRFQSSNWTLKVPRFQLLGNSLRKSGLFFLVSRKTPPMNMAHINAPRRNWMSKLPTNALSLSSRRLFSCSSMFCKAGQTRLILLRPHLRVMRPPRRQASTG